MHILFTCSFIVPMFSPTCLVLRPLIQLLYPASFGLNLIIFREEFFSLGKENVFFSLAYAVTIFVLAQLLSWVEYSNRLEKLRLTRKLAKAIEEKSSLVRVLSHDLANPITIILHRVTQLHRFFENDPDEKKHKAVKSIETATNSIVSITNKVKEIEMQKGFDVQILYQMHLSFQVQIK